MPAQRYKDYITRWQNESYYDEVLSEAAEILSDGCSGVPDFYRVVCLEHDIHYATHMDYWTSEIIVQEDADKYLKWGIQYYSWFGRASPMAWWRYRALSNEKGWGLGYRAWQDGPHRLKVRLAVEAVHKKRLEESAFDTITDWDLGYIGEDLGA